MPGESGITILESINAPDDLDLKDILRFGESARTPNSHIRMVEDERFRQQGHRVYDYGYTVVIWTGPADATDSALADEILKGDEDAIRPSDLPPRV